jgi:hypothetical protein
MQGSTLKKAAAVGVAGLAIAVTSSAIAAGQDGSSAPGAFLDAVAAKLGVSSARLEAAAKSAAVERVDAQLEAGAITEEQAAAMKERIASGDGRPFGPGGPAGPRGFGGPGGPGQHLEDAAGYLGLTRAELERELEDGATLAEIADAQGKTVAGLKTALLVSEEEELAAAVKGGRLTQDQADELLDNAGARFDGMIDGKLPEPPADPGGSLAQTGMSTATA